MRLRSARRAGARALAVLAWLGACAQPCMAAWQPAPAAAAHCPHMGAAGGNLPCPAMSGGGCEAGQPLQADGPPAAPARAQPDVAFAAAAGPSAGPPRCAPPGGTGPPVHIRYCSLSN